MADYRTAFEAQQIERVRKAMVESGLLEFLFSDNTRLAAPLRNSLLAFGLAVYRGSICFTDVSRVITESEEQAYRGQKITSLEERLHTMATQLHARDPKLRASIP